MSVCANYECHYLLTVEAYKAAKASSPTSYDFLQPLTNNMTSMAEASL